MNREKLLVANGITAQISKLEKEKNEILNMLKIESKKGIEIRVRQLKGNMWGWYFEEILNLKLGEKILKTLLTDIENELDLLNAQLDEL